MIALVVASIALSANVVNLNAHVDLYYNLEKSYWSSRVSWNQLVRHLHTKSSLTTSMKTSGKVKLVQDWYWRLDSKSFQLAGIPINKLDLNVSADSNFSTTHSILSGLVVKK